MSSRQKIRHTTDYERWKKRLKEILAFLDRLTEAHLTDEQFQKLGIEFSDLDIPSTKTPGRQSQFFIPASEKVFEVQNSGIDPTEDVFSQSCRSKRRKVYKDSGWPEDLRRAFGRYRGALSARGSGTAPQISQGHYILSDPIKRGRWDHYQHRNGRQRFQTEWAEEFYPERKPHRLVEMTTDDYGVDGRPCVSELIVLVILFSFVKPARGRVIQGYFDGSLKIQMTKFYDFNVPDYVDVMNSFLRWGFASAHGNTTLEKSLPMLAEDAEEDEEAFEDSHGFEGTDSKVPEVSPWKVVAGSSSEDSTPAQVKES